MFVRGTRPPSVQRYLYFLNSFHKEVVHVRLIKNIPESEPCSEEDESSFKCLYLITQMLIMSWLKIRKQRGCRPTLRLKYKIPVTTNFRILSYDQRRTRPPSISDIFMYILRKWQEEVLHFCLIKNPSEPYSEEDESSFQIHSFIVYA